MKAKYVKLILNCSYSTILNYVKTGKIKIKKVLANGLKDYDEMSVYSMLGNSISPKNNTNFIFLLDADGNKHEFYVTNSILNKVLYFLLKMQQV